MTDVADPAPIVVGGRSDVRVCVTVKVGDGVPSPGTVVVTDPGAPTGSGETGGDLAQGPAGAPGVPGKDGAPGPRGEPGPAGVVQSVNGKTAADITLTGADMVPALDGVDPPAGSIGDVLRRKAGLAGPLITFNRLQPDSVDTLLRELVWGQGRSVIEFDPTAMNKDGDGGAALAKAVAALPDGGGVVIAPPMDQGYALNLGTTTIPFGAKPNVAVVGAGAGRSNMILPNGHNQDVFTVADGAFSPLLAGFTVTGYGTTGTAPAYLLNAPRAISARMIDIAVVNIHSVARLGGPRGRYNGVRAQGLRPGFGIGLNFDGDQASEQNQIWDCDFINGPGQDAFAGVYIARGSSFEIIGVQAVKMGSPLIVKPTAGSNVYSIVLIDWWSDTSSGVGFILDGTAGLITRVEAHASWFSSCQRGVDIMGNVWGAKFFPGTKIYDNFSDGVRVYSGATLKSLKFSDALIAGNGVRQGGNQACGINLLGNTSDLDIHDCSFGNDADFGENTYADIAIAAGVDKYSIMNNRFGRADGRAPVIGHTAAATRIAANNRGWTP